MHRGKVDPGVSELPRDNELSRDHVNRPLGKSQELPDKLVAMVTPDYVGNQKITFFDAP